jgi:hypothetical protein
MGSGDTAGLSGSFGDTVALRGFWGDGLLGNSPWLNDFDTSIDSMCCSCSNLFTMFSSLCS